MITVYTIAYNEEFFLPVFIGHYKTMFPGCHIVVYDNQSTDKTAWIARFHGCEVRTYDTGGKLSDKTYLEIKNNCWRDAKTDWVLIADVDELLVIDADLLSGETASIIKFAGINLVNMFDNMNLNLIEHGVRSASYDKYYLFNKTKINDINYGPGCHNASPRGEITFSEETYPALHYKYINPDYMVKRHAVFASRLSDDNKKRGLGFHYTFSEEKIRAEFQDARNKAVKLTDIYNSLLT